MPDIRSRPAVTRHPHPRPHHRGALAGVVIATLAVSTLACRKPEKPAPPAASPATMPTPVPPPAPPASAPSARPLPAGDASKPRLLSHRSPAVPPRCLPLGLGGDVRSFVFEVSVDEQGTVRAVRTLGQPTFSPPCPEFEIAWHVAIRQWRYAPAMLRGRAVAATTTVSIDFKE